MLSLTLGLVFGGLLTWYLQRNIGYQELHFAQCSTPDIVWVSPTFKPTGLDAFLWGYGAEPVRLEIFHGRSNEPQEKLLIKPVDQVLRWDRHGD